MIFAAIALTLCAPGPRDNCVVDGDTFWLAGEKVRIADIDTPELKGECPSEIARARQARDRLLAILNSAPFQIQREREDRYGRTLAIITNGRGSVGNQLVTKGLARTWSGHREGWCGE